MAPTSLAATLLLLSLTSAQKIGTAVPERHPPLTTYKCTLAGGCTPVKTSVVIDSSTRSLHSIDSTTTPCNLGGPLCDTPEKCAASCALEGIDYNNWGVHTDNSSLTLNQWRKDPDTGRLITTTPRTYLVSESGDTYENVTLLNAELTFDVDLSQMPCGMNGALYLSAMELDGGRSVSKGLNPAGATYGTGYCDAQCPTLPFINGALNPSNALGACCSEMDIWEANAKATTYTPHPCNATRIRTCATETDCGREKCYCDKWGCSYNSYSHGYHDFYGPGKTVDTTKKFSVVTQFVAKNGKLADIRRLYVQDGKTIKNTVAKVAGGKLEVDSITDAYCAAQATWTQERGGIEEMGRALAQGMVLIFSIWADDGGFMSWLDSGTSGPCNATEGDPKLIQQHTPGASITFSNIRWGEIGSTFSGN